MLAAFPVTLLGTGESVRGPVSEAVRLACERGLPNETNAMFTNVEGEWDEVTGSIRVCVEEVAEAPPRASVFIKLDCRPQAPSGALLARSSRSSAGCADSRGLPGSRCASVHSLRRCLDGELLTYDRCGAHQVRERRLHLLIGARLQTAVRADPELVGRQDV
jgi:uncharacterized protein YqgV (UPF0045/DUF77 family)